jgi:hypothetical protein
MDLGGDRTTKSEVLMEETNFPFEMWVQYYPVVLHNYYHHHTRDSGAKLF